MVGIPLEMPSIVLASRSPRRCELLSALGVAFTVCPADVDETPHPNESPIDLAKRLSRTKAYAIARDMPQALVIAADTLVIHKGRLLGKPGSPEEAFRMLRELRGCAHDVVTGLALVQTATDRESVQVACTPVFMRAYTDAEIYSYVKTGDPLDKAGAYAVQNAAFAPVERLEGCYANVVGLPLCHLYRVLRAWGFMVRHPLQVCPWPLQHDGLCPWADAILAGAPEPCLQEED